MYNYYPTDLLRTCQRAPGYLYKLKQTNQRSKPHSHKPRQLASHLSPHPSSHHLPNTKALLPELSSLTGTIMPVQLPLCSRGITSDGHHLYYTRIPSGGDHLCHIADRRHRYSKEAKETLSISFDSGKLFGMSQQSSCKQLSHVTSSENELHIPQLCLMHIFQHRT